MLGYMMSDRDNPALPLLLTLKSEGIIPEQVISDPGVFLAVAKHGYHCSDVQTLISVLYRSARHWKRRCGILEEALDEDRSTPLAKEAKKDLIDICKSLVNICESREKEHELELMRKTVDNFILEDRLKSNVESFIHIIKEVTRFHGPALEFYITAKLRELGLFNILFLRTRAGTA
jgi:hypothetical protein